MNSIPESTRERARKYLGCGGEGVSWNDLQDKPFYTEPGVPVQTLVCSGEKTANENGTFDISNDGGLSRSQYIIKIDGTEYKADADFDAGRYVISFGDGYTASQSAAEDPSITFAGFAASTTYSVEVYEMAPSEDIVVPLENKYVPVDYINELIDQRLSELGVTTQS